MSRPDVCTRVLVVSLVAAAAGCGRVAPEEVESEAVVPVEVEPAARGDIRALVRATGVVTAAPGAELLVVAPEPARIAELPQAEGDRVARGALLVRFEIPTTSAEVARQRAESARAEARIANAAAAQGRARDLVDRGVAARKELEDADRDLAEAQAALAQAQAGLAAATSTASRATVVAPFSGVVAKRFHNPGDLVEAATGDAVLRFVDPQRVEVVVSIAPGDVPRVADGARATMIAPTAGRLRVAARPATVDPATGGAPMRLVFVGATPALALGTPVQVDVEATARIGVLLVPAAAVVRDGEAAAVFVAEGDKAARRGVTLGVSDGRHVEVVSGLAAGERVITRGHVGLPDGAAITVSVRTP